MSKWLVGLALGVVLAVGLPLSARAQTPYELNLHGGGFFLDEDLANDTDVMFGARMFLHLPSGLGFGGNFDWVLSDTDFDGDDIDQNLYLYSAELTYAFPTSGQVEVFLNGGIGAATFKFSDVPEPFDDSQTELLVPVGGGLRWYNRVDNPSWAIRGDVRDNIIFFNDQVDPVEGDEDTKATHNFEVTGGLSFIF